MLVFHVIEPCYLSEYIIDLMGAPGMLILSQVPSSLLIDTAQEARVFSDGGAAVNNLSLIFDKVAGLERRIPDIVGFPRPYLKDTYLSALPKQEQEIAARSDLWRKKKRSRMFLNMLSVRQKILNLHRSCAQFC